MNGEFASIGALLLFVVVAGFQSATPIMFAATGGSFSAQVNVFNVALEALLLGSAFAAFLVADATTSVWLGLLAAMLTGTLLAALFAFLTVTLGANEIVIGFAMNIAVVGLTAVLLTTIFDSPGSYLSATAGKFPMLYSDIGWLAVLAVALVLLGHLHTFHTRAGLRMRAIGQDPAAALAAGLRVNSYKYRAVLMSGLLCGIGGAVLPLSGLQLFSVGMTAGIGFIAIAAVILADGRPLLAGAAALFFGFTSAIGIALQTYGFPNELVLSLPYVATVVALFVKAYVTRRRAAAAKAAQRERGQARILVNA
ncbi:ABC transporter permease [Actinoplanes bogorensis]|uniref:ABC transporter permease n=1 Tax=Paractinoplanes bogorensis TaxID=1610840 RepID=A0ABS5YJY6_9ACTN|nr:ABC transporter permease [Actinoplanes bogorensis]MBU2663778.1 ABC transporter permease [Actinoplanes bogorensis]